LYFSPREARTPETVRRDQWSMAILSESLIGVYPMGKIQEYGAKVTSVAKQISHKLGANAGSIPSMEAKQKKIEKANKGMH
jgi:hypothetical protein